MSDKWHGISRCVQIINSEKTMNKRPKIENLKSFKKGQTGNPNGRPKKLPAIDELLDKVLGTDGSGKSEAEAILNALKAKAKRGDVRAAELLLDRAYGKAKQAIQMSGDKENPLFIEASLTQEQIDRIID